MKLGFRIPLNTNRIASRIYSKAELKVGLIILLADNDYPPVDRDEVYKEIFEQAENFKKYQM
jgi:hypothetical protein